MTSKTTLAIALALLTFSAKPMYQPILEQTCNFLAEVAPEIALVGGALLAAERADTYSPMPPMTEQVKYTSGSAEMDLAESVTDIIIVESSKPIDEGGCNPF